MDTAGSDMQAARMAALRRQHRAAIREGYDGHNRHGGITTIHRLRERRWRRLIRRSLARWRQLYSATVPAA